RGLADHHRPLELRVVPPYGRTGSGDEDVARLEDDVVRERVRNGRIATDLPAVTRFRAVLEEHALGAVQRTDRVEHRERRLCARPPAHLRFGRADSRVPLKENVREIAPLGALTDERD